MKPSTIIQKYGWVQGVNQSPSGYCAIGAIWKAYGGRCTEQPRSRIAVDKLRNLIGTPYITRWNDAKGQTKRKVLKALRRVGL